MEIANYKRGRREQTNRMKSKNHIVVKEHPLNNALILDEIFDHLPKSNWKSARLVNKTWHSSLQPRWRKEMSYRLGLGKSSLQKTFTAQFMKQQHPANNPNDPFLLDRYPIQNMSVRWGWNNHYVLMLPSQTRFWELYGHGLKRLNLDCVRIYRAALLKRLLFELTPNLEEFRYDNCDCDDMDKLELNTSMEYSPPVILQKNLTTLIIDTHNYFEDENTDNDDYKPRFPISWIEFFSVFPNVQKLFLEIDLRDSESERPSDLLKLLQAIDIIRQANDNEVLNITTLQTPGYYHVDVIKNQSVFATLPISSLTMVLGWMSTEAIVTLVQTLKLTLRHLELHKPIDLLDLLEGAIGTYFPENMLPQGLKILRLFGPVFPSFKFLSYTPNLEELELQNFSSMLQPEINLDAVMPLVNLTKLTFNLQDAAPGAQIDILAKVMPNVKRCICIVDAEGFQALCRGWPDLGHLEVTFNFDSEDFFVENLIKLKCLRSLAIYCNGVGEVTDKSVFEAFLMLPVLTKIHLPLNAAVTVQGLTTLKGKLYRSIHI